MPISRLASHSSGNAYPNFFAKAEFCSTVSKETPRIATFLFW